MTAVAALTLVACATTSHQRPEAPLIAVPSGDVKALLKDYRLDLKDISAESIGAGKLDPSSSDREVWVELPATSLFEQGNAQLKIEALKPLGDIAEAIAARGACVTHIVAYAADDAAADLADRRAASVMENLSREPISLGRLRAESRIDLHRADKIFIALRPVVLGRENEAWVPPAIGE